MEQSPARILPFDADRHWIGFPALADRWNSIPFRVGRFVGCSQSMLNLVRNVSRALRAALLWVGLLAASVAQDAAPTTLRVLTYNIKHGEGTDGVLDLDRIAAVIKAANPDLVALQEVDQNAKRSGRVDQAARLGDLTDLQAAFAKAIDLEGGGYGVAILSRWALQDLKTHLLPKDPEMEQRIAFAARVMLGQGGQEIEFMVTHLDHHSDPAQRIEQVAKIRELYPSGADERPRLLAGDFNTTPERSVMKSLLKEWTDTAAGQRFFTIPAGKPRRKIDYILCRPAGRWIVQETRALDEPIASDHRAVLAVLELTR